MGGNNFPEISLHFAKRIRLSGSSCSAAAAAFVGAIVVVLVP